jgi:hypothetical protein
MRNGSDRESNPRPQRWQALMLISNIGLTTASLWQPWGSTWHMCICRNRRSGCKLNQRRQFSSVATYISTSPVPKSAVDFEATGSLRDHLEERLCFVPIPNPTTSWTRSRLGSSSALTMYGVFFKRRSDAERTRWPDSAKGEVCYCSISHLIKIWS